MRRRKIIGYFNFHIHGKLILFQDRQQGNIPIHDLEKQAFEIFMRVLKEYYEEGHFFVFVCLELRDLAWQKIRPYDISIQG